MNEQRIGAHAQLRAATRDAHEMVDAAFGRFDLADHGDYAAFLRAHARALQAVEPDLSETMAPGEARLPLLADDLVDLDATLPPPLPSLRLDSAAAAWGARYVLEGSRLGAAMLMRQVATAFPTRYLGARHPGGGWRRFTAALDEALHDDQAIGAARAAADRVFLLFAAAAAAERTGADKAV